MVVAGLGAVALALAATLSTDAPGRLVIGLAALGLALVTLFAGIRRPRLTLTEIDDEPALALRTLTGVRLYPRTSITRVRATETRRLGRRSAMLEIDLLHDDDERLLVLTRWDLGADPRDVAETLATRGLR